MAFSSRSYVNRYIPSNRFPTGLKWLLIVNLSIFVLSYILRASRADLFLHNFALVPAQVVQTFAVWQLVTYMFLHFGIGQILWNMLALWMFGVELERLWGEEPLAYRSWSVHAGPSPLEREFWRRRDVEVVDMAPAAYVAELEAVLA